MSDTARLAADPATDVPSQRLADSEPRQADRDGDSAPTRRFKVGQTVRTTLKLFMWPAGSRVKLVEPSGDLCGYDYSGEFEDGTAMAFREDELANDWPESRQAGEIHVQVGDLVSLPVHDPDFPGFRLDYTVAFGACDGEDPFGAAVDALYTEAQDLLMSKHADYGPRNISAAPGGPLNGLAVRLHDKLSRLTHLLQTEGEPNHESLRDTLLDIGNYGLIGVLCADGNWPE